MFFIFEDYHKAIDWLDYTIKPCLSHIAEGVIHKSAIIIVNKDKKDKYMYQVYKYYETGKLLSTLYFIEEVA